MLCLDLLTEPVVIPCGNGHLACRKCVLHHFSFTSIEAFDEYRISGTISVDTSCPFCRAFTDPAKLKPALEMEVAINITKTLLRVRTNSVKGNQFHFCYILT